MWRSWRLKRGAKKKAQLKEALAAQLDPIYQLLLRQHMEQVRLLQQQVEEINQVLAVAMQGHTATLVRLRKRSLVPQQFASWVGVCAGSQESPGVCYSHRSAKGNRYLRRLLCQIAWAAIHTKDTFFAGLFARSPRGRQRRAAWAVAHRVPKVIWLMPHGEVEYQEKGSHTPIRAPWRATCGDSFENSSARASILSPYWHSLFRLQRKGFGGACDTSPCRRVHQMRRDHTLLEVWLRLFVVMNPKRRVWPDRTRSAARCHQCINVVGRLRRLAVNRAHRFRVAVSQLAAASANCPGRADFLRCTGM
jgi:hypothetical protein